MQELLPWGSICSNRSETILHMVKNCQNKANLVPSASGFCPWSKLTSMVLYTTQNLSGLHMTFRVCWYQHLADSVYSSIESQTESHLAGACLS